MCVCVCVTGVNVCMSVLGTITHSLCICHLVIKLYCKMTIMMWRRREEVKGGLTSVFRVSHACTALTFWCPFMWYH